MLSTSLPDGLCVDEHVRLCAEADLCPDGTFGIEWLVITDAHVQVFAERGVTPRCQFLLAELTSPKAENLIGGGALVVTYQDQRIELVRYTSGRAPHFASVASLLEKWINGEDASLPDTETKRCPRCNYPLDKGTNVCPACLPRSKALRRLLGYLRPHFWSALSLSMVAITGTAFGLVPPYLQKPLLDKVLAPHGAAALVISERLRLLGLLVLVLVIVRIFASVVSVAQG
ncbi:MAG TPA: hypothetical protein VHV83_05275 [Armatimonadota bacterium]|nr:hypothetical protein [Armatimonadota bacterium]